MKLQVWHQLRAPAAIRFSLRSAWHACHRNGERPTSLLTRTAGEIPHTLVLWYSLGYFGSGTWSEWNVFSSAYMLWSCPCVDSVFMQICTCLLVWWCISWAENEGNLHHDAKNLHFKRLLMAPLLLWISTQWQERSLQGNGECWGEGQESSCKPGKCGVRRSERKGYLEELVFLLRT